MTLTDGFSTSKAVAFWLRRDIVRGVFEPTERLRVEHLVKFYRVGHSPVREAILLLSASGLVAHEHQKGYRTAPVSLTDYDDILAVYQRIYKLAISMAIEFGDQAWEERVVVQLHRSAKVAAHVRATDAQARERWQRSYWEFHGQLVSGCGSPLLLQLLGDIGFRLERYVNLFGDLASDHDRDHHREHREIVDAVTSRNAALAIALIDAYHARAQPIRNSITEKLKAAEKAPPRRRGRPAQESTSPTTKKQA